LIAGVFGQPPAIVQPAKTPLPTGPPLEAPEDEPDEAPEEDPELAPEDEPPEDELEDAPEDDPVDGLPDDEPAGEPEEEAPDDEPGSDPEEEPPEEEPGSDPDEEAAIPDEDPKPDPPPEPPSTSPPTPADVASAHAPKATRDASSGAPPKNQGLPTRRLVRPAITARRSRNRAGTKEVESAPNLAPISCQRGTSGLLLHHRRLAPKQPHATSKPSPFRWLAQAPPRA
jgi:hypothetical protein